MVQGSRNKMFDWHQVWKAVWALSHLWADSLADMQKHIHRPLNSIRCWQTGKSRVSFEHSPGKWPQSFFFSLSPSLSLRCGRSQNNPFTHEQTCKEEEKKYGKHQAKKKRESKLISQFTLNSDFTDSLKNYVPGWWWEQWDNFSQSPCRCTKNFACMKS